jgi:pSer/pThr/pTyr-binding forkhead associated (FHA) protein
MNAKAKAYLIVNKIAPGLKVKGCGEYSEIMLGDGTVIVGRPTADSVPDIGIIGEQRISREHMYISYDSAGACFVLCDHKSKWGTYLNDETLEKGKEYRLKPGDIIGLAKTNDEILVEFEFVTSLDETITQEGLVIRIRGRAVYLDGEPLDIKPAEWRVLEVLYNNRGKLCSIDQILVLGWPEHSTDGDYPNEETIAQYIHRLREKIEFDVKKPRYILTERIPGPDKKLGYKLLLE